MNRLGFSVWRAGRARRRTDARATLGGLLALAVMLTAASAAGAASITVERPADGAVLRHSAFKLKYAVAGLEQPYKVACLVNGRVPDSRFNCDPERGHADLHNGKHRLRLIAYETGPGHRTVVSRGFTVKVRDRHAARIWPALANGQVINATVPPFRFATAGALMWRCRVDGGAGQKCGPLPGHEYDRRAIGIFEPRHLSPGWHLITIQALDANHRRTTEHRIVGVLPGPGPQLTVTSPAAGSTVDSSPLSIGLHIAGASARVQCAVDGVRVRNCTGDDRAHGFGDERTAPLKLVNGTHTVSFRATDVVGNTSSASVRFTVADSTAPNVQILEPADGSVYTDISTWRMQGKHDAGFTECRLRPQAFVPCGGNMPTGAAWPDSGGWNVPHPTANGDYTLDLRVTDAQGRQSTATSNFRIDDHAAPDGYPIWPLLDKAPPLFPLLFSDYGEPWRCKISIDNSAFYPCSGKGAPPTLVRATCGPHLYVVRLEDGVGNAQTLARQITTVSSRCPATGTGGNGSTGAAGPTGSSGSAGPTGASGTTVAPETTQQPIVSLRKPAVRFFKHRRAKLSLGGAVSGRCDGTARLSVRLRGNRVVKATVPLISRKSLCGFSTSRTVAAARIAGLRTKLTVTVTTGAGTVYSGLGFRAPRP